MGVAKPQGEAPVAIEKNITRS